MALPWLVVVLTVGAIVCFAVGATYEASTQGVDVDTCVSFNAVPFVSNWTTQATHLSACDLLNAIASDTDWS